MNDKIDLEWIEYHGAKKEFVEYVIQKMFKKYPDFERFIHDEMKKDKKFMYDPHWIDDTIW